MRIHIHSLLLALLAILIPISARADIDVRLDGVADEWPQGVHAAADAEFMYFRLPFPELRALLAEDKPVSIRVDLDDNEATGKSNGGLGVDLEISLRHRESWRDPFFFATVFDRGGEATEIDFAKVEPLLQPNHASKSFEIRIRRDAHPTLMESGRARGVITMTEAQRVRVEAVTVWETVSVPFEAEFPVGSPVRPVEATLPVKQDGSVRIVAHNVLWSNPDENPEPFARMYKALDPDIYLIQEWGRGPGSPEYERTLEDWFRTHVDGSRDWTAVRSVGWGVAVVTHHPVIGRGPTEIKTETLTRWDFPVRFAGAAVITPDGPFAVGSIHLKAGGSLDTPEDQRRFDEAREIRGVMQRLALIAEGAPGDDAPVTVLGGDYNHNGHPKVPANAIRGLDIDATPLTMAYTPVLGTDSRYSFGGPAYGHRRSFLDYIAYPDARAEVTAAFVLDTEILSDSSLAGMGLERSDSSAADHLPVVVDLDPKD